MTFGLTLVCHSSLPLAPTPMKRRQLRPMKRLQWRFRGSGGRRRRPSGFEACPSRFGGHSFAGFPGIGLRSRKGLVSEDYREEELKKNMELDIE